MVAYFVRRLLGAIPVMAVVALVVFSLLYLSPGDPAALIAGDHAGPQQVAEIRARLGLDRPLPEQFMRWIWNVLRGDLGVSVFSNVPVTDLIRQRVEPTLALALCTMVLAIAVAVPMGVVAAWQHGRWPDRLLMLIAVLGFSTPLFVVAYLLIFGVSLKLGLLPVQGYTPLSQGLWPFLKNLVLPSVSLSLVYIALIARVTRASMLEVLSQDYIRTARAKGVATYRLLMRHALKNAAIPIVTVIGLGVALVIGGVVVTETVFAIPGLGRLTLDAITRRDYPVIQGLTLVFSFTYVVVNTLVDVSYTLFDPRIRYR